MSPAADRLWERLGGRIAFGGDYNPEQWPEEVWAQDVELMRAAGVNLVTVGVFSWALLEPRPGRFDFAWLDRVLDLLHDGGIAVDLATATASPPPWLAARHPESLPVTRDGVRMSIGSRQAYCPSSPAYREAAVRMATAMAERYAAHPALALWHVNNEYGAHTPRCYCDVSARDFRSWLERRHGDLDALNAAWGTAFWSQRYGDWEEIQPPRIAPYSSNPAQELDFRRFCSDALLACYELEREVLARVTPDVPVTTNFMGLFEPLDYWAWAAREDVVSHDAYPDPEDPVSHVDAALACDLMRSLRGGQPWMLMEQAASAVNWRPRNRPKRPGAMRRISLQAVARGADAIMYFQWRAAQRGSERFHSAMLPHAGTDSRTHREIRALGAELERLRPVVGARVPAQVALLHAWDSWWGLEAPDHPSTELRLADRIRDHYGPLWEADVPVDVRPPEADLSAYRLVVVPNLYLLSAEAAAGLARYVAGGGHLLVSFFSGAVDHEDAVWPGGWPGPLRDVLGLAVEEFWPLAPGESLELRSPDGTALGTASVWTEVLVPAGAEVVAEYADGDLAGAPAVTRHRHGDGVATYVATRPDPAAMAALLEEARAAAGVAEAPLRAPAGVEVVRRGDAIFLLNHTEEAVTVPLSKAAESLLDGRRHDGEVELPAGGAEVLALPTA